MGERRGRTGGSKVNSRVNKTLLLSGVIVSPAAQINKGVCEYGWMCIDPNIGGDRTGFIVSYNMIQTLYFPFSSYHPNHVGYITSHAPVVLSGAARVQL